MTVTTLGLALVTGLVALNWAAVRDSVEGWHFVSTRKTHTLMPDPELRGEARRFQGRWPDGNRVHVDHGDLLRLLTDYTGVPVVLDAQETTGYQLLPAEDCLRVTGEAALRNLRAGGYRILEQRFPRRAYVVAGYPPKRPTWRGYTLSTLSTKER